MFQRKAISLFLITAFVMRVAAFGQAAAVYTAPKETIDKIREEGNEQVAGDATKRQ